MTQANNVLKFPNMGLMPKPKNETELGEHFLQNKKIYIDHVVDHYSIQLINKLGMHGFDIYEEDFIKGYSYTIESLRATLYSTLDIYHPFNEHMDDMIEMLEEDDFEDMD